MEEMEGQRAQRQHQPQPHSHTAATDTTKQTAGMAALYGDGTVVNPTATSGSPPPFGMFPSWIRREILWENQQMAEARGRRPRAMVDAAAKAKRAKTTSAAATRVDDSDDDDSG